MTAPDGFTGPPVWTFDKREGRLIAGEREYKGTRFFELRLWVAEGEKPTGKGITLPCDAVADLAKALMEYAARETFGTEHAHAREAKVLAEYAEGQPF